MEERKKVNYDHPSALETDLLIKHLKLMLKGKEVEIPVYDFALHTRSSKRVKVKPASIILIEGAFIFC